VHDYVRRNCPNGVRFLNTVEDVPALLAEADLVVFPSLEPHFARPLIEAAAMGLPAVASNLEGPDELVENGETGILVPAGDDKALAEAITGILLHPQRGREMGEKAFQRAQVLFDADRNSTRIFQLYADLIGDTSSAKSNLSGRNSTRKMGLLVFIFWLMAGNVFFYLNLLFRGGRLERFLSLLSFLFSFGHR
jgi:hypothetical protein